MSKRVRVLVIDDDPLFRSLLVSLMRKDYFVSVASDGSEGFYKALEHPPDVAIIDVKMPGWDGLRTLKAFRGHPTLVEVRIIILTADASKETVLAAINGGANEYLIKTAFSRDDFHAKIDKLIPRSDRSVVPGPQAIASERAVGTCKRPWGLGKSVAATASASSANRPSLSRSGEDEDLQELLDCWE